MFLLNDKPLPLDTPFVATIDVPYSTDPVMGEDEDGNPIEVTPGETGVRQEVISYPANWLRNASPEERAAIGIVEVPDPERADDRFYWNGDITQPKDLDDIKSMLVAQVKATAGTLLARTDWMIVRAAEGAKPVDEDTLAARAAIRTASNDNEESIAACETVEELAALQFVWP